MPRPQGSYTAETLSILDAVKELIDPEQPTTVRFVLYALISRGVLESTRQYQKLIKVLMAARIRGDIDDDCFLDNQRRTVIPAMWDDLDDYGKAVINSYQRNHWQDQEFRVELWVEKNTVAGVLERVTRQWKVPLRASTGFFSRPFLCEARDQISRCGKKTFIYYVGDFDPSGMDIERAAQYGNDKLGIQKREGLSQLLSGLQIHEPQYVWKRLAVLPEDFAKLPDHAKVPLKGEDMRTPEFEKKYGKMGAEVEAIPQEELRARVEDAIRSHIDFKRWERSERTEQRDTNRLKSMFGSNGH